MNPSRSTPSSSADLPTISRWWWLIVGIGLLLLACSSTLIHGLSEYWWFEAAGFSKVFKIRLGWSVLCAGLAFATYAGVLFANYWLALWITRDQRFQLPRDSARNSARNSYWTPLIPGLVLYGGISLIVLLSTGAALRSADAWELLLQSLNPTAFQVADPIYQQDVGFYIFKLPLYQSLQRQGIELLIWALLLSVVVYAFKGEIRLERGWKYFLTGAVKTHLCVLLSVIAVAGAFGYWLARYDLLYSPTGVVFGAGYTDGAHLSVVGGVLEQAPRNMWK